MAVLVDFCGPDGRVAATVALPERTMFWSEGTFEPGDAFAAHADFFRALAASSERFQAANGDDEEQALTELVALWTDLNHDFKVRERGEPAWLADVGLLLEGRRARVRYLAPARATAVTGEQLDELETLVAGAGDHELSEAARTYMPRLIAEVRRARGAP